MINLKTSADKLEKFSLPANQLYLSGRAGGPDWGGVCGCGRRINIEENCGGLSRKTLNLRAARADIIENSVRKAQVLRAEEAGFP